jgi:hypothetical protein
MLAKTNPGEERLEEANLRRQAWRKWGALKERMLGLNNRQGQSRRTR